MKDTSWDSYNEFLLHGTVDRFSKILARYELFKRIICLPGDIVEGGVFKGAGILYWAKLIEIFNPLSIRKVVGFDTFTGYPSFRYESDIKASRKLISDANYTGTSSKVIMQIADSLNLSHRIELVEGDATVTISNYVEDNPGFRVALLNLDFDIYEPTIAALKNLFPLVVPNGIIAFDEYAVKEWSESNAVDEFFKGERVTYQSLPWALSPTAFLEKQP